jgi:hypothetical protein
MAEPTARKAWLDTEPVKASQDPKYAAPRTVSEETKRKAREAGKIAGSSVGAARFVDYGATKTLRKSSGSAPAVPSVAAKPKSKPTAKPRAKPAKKSPMFSASEDAEMRRLSKVANATKGIGAAHKASFDATKKKNKVKTGAKSNRGYDSYKKLMG